MKIWTYLIKTTAFLKLLRINPLLAMVIFAETYFRRFTVAAHPEFLTTSLHAHAQPSIGPNVNHTIDRRQVAELLEAATTDPRVGANAPPMILSTRQFTPMQRTITADGCMVHTYLFAECVLTSDDPVTHTPLHAGGHAIVSFVSTKKSGEGLELDTIALIDEGVKRLNSWIRRDEDLQAWDIDPDTADDPWQAALKAACRSIYLPDRTIT